MNDWQALWTIVGLTLVSVLTRGLLMLPKREWPLPGWLHRGLRHAPLAALVAVVAPEILLHGGAWPTSWRDPQLFAAAAAVAWFFWRRSILGTIVVGTAVLLGLRLGLGW
jgi:branched-subunit amino acid transport protein